MEEGSLLRVFNERCSMQTTRWQGEESHGTIGKYETEKEVSYE